jgi:GTPase involved in cell partitioning and DNA repair
MKRQTITVLVLDDAEKEVIKAAADPKSLTEAVKALTEELKTNAKQILALAKDEPNNGDLDDVEKAINANSELLAFLPDSDPKKAAQRAYDAALALVGEARQAPASQGR